MSFSLTILEKTISHLVLSLVVICLALRFNSFAINTLDVNNLESILYWEGTARTALFGAQVQYIQYFASKPSRIKVLKGFFR